ncbi:MAG: serine/threonine protein kinase [Chloroflexi bacterium]|nr:serine/threonine protein kinase [Chloroflexota bacterium]
MADPLIGKKLGDYVIQELLGKGGMARVYKGYDERLQRYAAVKVIASELATADQTEYRVRFEREARAIAKLDQHPNIVKVYQFGEYEQLYFMAMAFIEGKDLRQVLREYNERAMRMPHADVVSVVQDIGDALDYAHSLGVIHRDVKPSNIMITPHKQAVLTDFGLVLSVSDGTLGDTFGSAHYIAPEQAVSSKNAVPQSDLYSLGVCAYEMLTGRVPFDAPSAMSIALKHLHDMPPSPLEFAPELPSSVEAVLFKILDKDPERRYASGAEFARALALALFGGDTEHLPIKRSAPLAPRRLSDSSASRRFTPASDWVEANDADRGTLNLRPPQLARSQAPPAKKRGFLFPALIGVLLLFAALVTFFLGRLPETPAAALTETALAALPSATHTFTRTPSDVLLVQPTVTLTIALTVAPSSAHTPTATRTDTATQTQTPAPVAVQHTATLTASPSREPTLTSTLTPTPLQAVVRTLTPTHTFTPTPEPLGPDILLVYDNDQLNLINISRRTLDLLDLNFVQEGAELYLFSAAEWALTGAVRKLNSFPPGWCLKVSRIERQIESRFRECRSLASFRYVAPTKQFWRAHSAAATTFSVRLGDQEVAVCEIAAKRCTFSLPSRATQ